MRFQQLRIHENKRHIMNQDGTPFFYLADTAWELFHRLTREEAQMYLDVRAQAGFTAIQAVALAEFDGVRIPNAYGRYPLKKDESGEWDIDLPDTDGEYSYWDHVDFIVKEAEERGLYIAMLPAWGDKFNIMWGKGPLLFTPDNAARYGKWIGTRYTDSPNIIWVMGGDRLLDTRAHFDIINNMAKSIRTADSGRHLITFHPTGGHHSSTALHDEAWLDFNMIQSGHDRKRFNYMMIEKDYKRTPHKPVIDAEPGYEDHPDAFNPQNGYLDAADARQFAYMSLFTGACGHTYGNHSIWGMIKSIPVEGFQPGHFCVTWKQALYSPGAGQMRHAKNLVLSRNFLTGEPASELVPDPMGGVLHMPVLRGVDYLMAYSAQGQPVRLKAGCMRNRPLTGWWYDPRLGKAEHIGDVSDEQDIFLVPPSGGRGNDWVLVLDEKAKGYEAPGIIN